MTDIFRIPPYHYIHVRNRNENITRLIVGPKTFVKQDHEEVITGDKPQKHVVLSPYSFCQIENPVCRDENGKPVFDDKGQVKVRLQDSEIRTSEQYSAPFPLYPREEISKYDDLPIVPRDHALLLECVRDFTDADQTKRVAGEQWLEYGPKHYLPDIHVKIVKTIEPEVIVSGTALQVEATRACKDYKGVQRQTGEQWLVRDLGFYIPSVNETVIGLVNHIVTEENKALRLKAIRNFRDVYGKDRKAGEEWLITTEIASSHIVDVSERL